MQYTNTNSFAYCILHAVVHMYSPILRTCRSANLPETKWELLRFGLTLDGVENMMCSQASSLFIRQRMSSAALVSHCMRERARRASFSLFSCFTGCKNAENCEWRRSKRLTGTRQHRPCGAWASNILFCPKQTNQLSEEVMHESSTGGRTGARNVRLRASGRVLCHFVPSTEAGW
jgi:hypothetical protein